MYASILQVISICVSLYPFPSIVNNYCTSFNRFQFYFSWKASRAIFNQSVYVCEKKRIHSRREYLTKTKWTLLELSRTWWYKSNEYSLSNYNFLSHCKKKTFQGLQHQVTSQQELCLQSRWQENHQSIVHVFFWMYWQTPRYWAIKRWTFW